MINSTDTVIVSFNACDDPDEELLVVGRKIFGNNNVEIVNAIQGARARELWDALNIQKKDEDA